MWADIAFFAIWLLCGVTAIVMVVDLIWGPEREFNEREDEHDAHR